MISLRCLFAVAIMLLFSAPGSAFAAEPAMEDSMMHNMSHNMGEYSDKAFLSGMIPHHKAAVEMSEEVLKNGQDEQVKEWAHQIIADQNSEIELMENWLRELGGPDEHAAARMEKSMREMMSMEMSANPDRAFVGMMIPHHAGALEMAVEALTNSRDERIIDLSRQIIRAQTDEIIAFKKWLAAH